MNLNSILKIGLAVSTFVIIYHVLPNFVPNSEYWVEREVEKISKLIAHGSKLLSPANQFRSNGM